MNFNARIEISGPLLAQGPAVVQRHIESFVTEATLLLHREVLLRTPQGVHGAQGGLLGSIQHDVLGRGTRMVRGEVVTGSPYGEVVERGRRPGKWPPPGGALREWVALKFGVSGRDLDRAEFLVRRKIARQGTPGHAMFSRGLMENLTRLQSMAEARGLKLAVDLSGE